MKCSDEISIGEYVRTISGNIDKVDALYGMIEDTIHLENHKWQSIKNIVKHSKNIIDLVCEGDYVNGCQVMGIYVPRDTWEPIQINVDSQTIKYFIQDEIKSIVTKEQIKQIEYRIKE